MRVAFCWALLAAGCAVWAEAPVAPYPVVASGRIGDEDTNAEKVMESWGRAGVLLIRSQARWEDVQVGFKAFPLAAGKGLPKIDFGKENAVLVYDTWRRHRDTFRVTGADLAAKPPGVTCLLEWDNRLEKDMEKRVGCFLLAVIPAGPAVKVAVDSERSLEGRHEVGHEFMAMVGDPAGDVVDGLQAAITAKAAAVKAGEDIQIDFALQAAPNTGAAAEQFMRAPTPRVWDSKYSEGYHNYGFYVTTPDGQTRVLRPKVIDQWDKNAPHPVEITKEKPYHLEGWAVDEHFKSLKTLGLDTSRAGTYTITGVYEEAARPIHNPDKQMWAGSITSNTVVVKVGG